MDEGNEEEDESLEADAMIKVTTMFHSFLRQKVAHRNGVYPDPRIKLGLGSQIWIQIQCLDEGRSGRSQMIPKREQK
jgi:hypothetical protein